MRALMDMGFGRRKVSRAGKSTRESSLRTDARGQPRKVINATLPGKASKEDTGIRTTNRHRWTR
jgi:hypothetical protein